MTTKDARYEVTVYDGDGKGYARYSEDRAEAEKYAALNGGVLVDTLTGDVKIWL